MRERHDNQFEEAAHKIAESICGLASVVLQLTNEIHCNNDNHSVLQRIDQLEKLILMTSAQLESALNNQTTQIGKIAKEQSDRFDVLTETIRLLNEQIGQGGEVTPAVEKAQANVQAALDNMDAAIPDAPEVIPPTPTPA